MRARSVPSKLPSLLLLAAALAAAAPARTATIWTGPVLFFEKDAFADATDPANQDRLTDQVILTRENVQGLINAAVESAFGLGSPEGTEWAWSINNPGLAPEDITAANYANLAFDDWRDAHDGNPPATVGIPGVLHLIGEDIYLDIEFLSWGEGPLGGGAFSYLRATPVPEPASGALLALGLVHLARRRR